MSKNLFLDHIFLVFIYSAKLKVDSIPQIYTLVGFCIRQPHIKFGYVWSFFEWERTFPSCESLDSLILTQKIRIFFFLDFFWRKVYRFCSVFCADSEKARIIPFRACSSTLLNFQGTEPWLTAGVPEMELMRLFWFLF